MNLQIRSVGYLTAALAAASLVGAYFLAAGFWQSALINLGTTFLGLGLAVIVVNHYLAQGDKKLAAQPVLKLIAPHVDKLHNELFIRHLHRKLGKDQFESLIGIYQKHNRNPRAFSPEQRDALYQTVLERKDDLLKIYETLQEQFRELTLLLGWSFDSTITGAALEARINFATFKAAAWDDSDDDKTSLVEAYLDAEAAVTRVFASLQEHLGRKEDEWQKQS